MSDPALPPGWNRRQTLIDALADIDATLEELARELDGINTVSPDQTGVADLARPKQKMQDLLQQGRAVTEQYGASPSPDVLTALRGLLSAAKNVAIPARDPDLGTTRSLQALLKVQGLLRSLTERAIDAAEAVNEAGNAVQDDPVSRALTGDEELRVLDRLNEVWPPIRRLEHAEAAGPLRRVIQRFIGAVRIELDLAEMHLTINDRIIDFGALVRSTELIAELTARLVQTVQALTARVPDAVKRAVDATQRSVGGVVEGVQRLGRVIGRRRREARAAAEQRRLEEPAGDPRVIEPEMVEIPPCPDGFLMGIPEAESEREGVKNYDNNARPQTLVTFRSGFLLARYPVTRGEFAAFVADTQRDMSGTAYGLVDGKWQRSDKIDWRNPGFEQDDRHPVVCVSHEDAEDYAAWLSRKTGRHYRLPSEAEWEYAARANKRTARFWGDGWDEASSYAHAQAGGTAPVGSYKANGFGLFDMIGNVWEWVADHWHENYEGLPRDGSAWTTGGSAGLRVLRGGAGIGGPWIVRAGSRDRGRSGDRGSYAGFRLARTL